VPQEKITFAQFHDTVEVAHQAYVQDLYTYLIDSGCKIAFDEKKNGYLASIKVGKPPRALANFLFRKSELLVRIYGENIDAYTDFLQTLPAEMVESIVNSGICGRLVNNTCSPKCTGYDFMIDGKHMQKCRYNCFEFLVTDTAKPFIRAFIEHELGQRSV